MQTPELDVYVTKHIPYRMRSIAWFRHLIRHTGHWTEAKRIEVYIDGKLSVIGNHRIITNPAIEIGIVHCRVLLEFLGLSAGKEGRLVPVMNRRKDDKFIESFSRHDGSRLAQVSPDQAYACYKGPSAEAERVLVAVIKHANKAVAHITDGPIEGFDSLDQIECAASGVLALICRYFYDELAQPRPDYEIHSQTKSA